MCDYCAKAQQVPDYPLYQAQCKTCTVRAMAHGLPFWQSKREGTLMPAYVNAMQAAFGDEWRTWHEKVKTEHARIGEARGLL
jgi:hypothetical protein